MGARAHPAQYSTKLWSLDPKGVLVLGMAKPLFRSLVVDVDVLLGRPVPDVRPAPVIM